MHTLFRQLGLRHLAVIPRASCVVGVITRHDLLPEALEDTLLGQQAPLGAGKIQYRLDVLRYLHRTLGTVIKGSVQHDLLPEAVEDTLLGQHAPLGAGKNITSITQKYLCRIVCLPQQLLSRPVVLLSLASKARAGNCHHIAHPSLSGRVYEGNPNHLCFAVLC